MRKYDNLARVINNGQTITPKQAVRRFGFSSENAVQSAICYLRKHNKIKIAPKKKLPRVELLRSMQHLDMDYSVAEIIQKYDFKDARAVYNFIYRQRRIHGKTIFTFPFEGRFGEYSYGPAPKQVAVRGYQPRRKGKRNEYLYI